MKKRTLSLLLALSLLSGCGAPAPEEPEVLPEEPPAAESAALPETRPLEPISAPAIVTQGRVPAEKYELPQTLYDLDNPELDFGLDFGPSPALLAELPPANAAFYALEGGETVLVSWDNCMAEFDWTYLTPRRIPPWMDCFDADGDGENELIIVCYVGSGTNTSFYELHILEKNPDGTLTAYAFPESLWREQLPRLFDTAQVRGRTFAVLGHELVEIDGEDLDLEAAPSSGLFASFCKEQWDGLRFEGAFCLTYQSYPIPLRAAWTSAEVLYQDGIFTLRDFHLYSYDQ